MIKIKLSELINAFEASSCKFICNTIHEMIGSCPNVTEDFREQWFKLVHNVHGKSAIYEYGFAYMNGWNTASEYSLDAFYTTLIKADLGEQIHSNNLFRKYRIWVLNKVLEDKGDLEFIFGEEHGED